MSFETIIDQPMAVTLVQRWLAKNTTQPLLFYGPEGSGKRAVALETAKALNCQNKPSPGLRPPSPSIGRGKSDMPPLHREGEGDGGEGGCGSCLSCKKISAGNHPDVRVLDRAYQAAVRGEPIEKQQSLRIETVLEERERLYQTANEGAWKISILDEAHRLTPDAANVLLKVLEEPPPRTAIFLMTPYRDRIFSTLISRCQTVRFRSRAGTLGSDPGIDALWEKLPALTPGQILARRDTRPNRADIESQLLSLLSPAVRDLRGGRPNAADKVELIQKAQQQLKQNVPPALVYDHLLLKLSGQGKP